MSEVRIKIEVPEKKSEQTENKPEEKVSPFVCDMCDKVFEKKGPLSNHRNLVHTLRSKEMHCDFCEDFFLTKQELCSHISSKHSEYFIKHEVESQGEKEEPEEDQVKLNYILDNLKNLKVAKLNTRKQIEPKRIEIDDQNIRYETNSAFYLVCKEELMKLNKGYSEVNNGIRLEVESKMNQVDNVNNNPTTVIKMKVTEIKTDFESKVTMNLYHSNQGVHLQGGRRKGSITSCSLLAIFLEDFFKKVQITQSVRIQNIRDVLLGLDLRKNYGKNQTLKKGQKVAKEKKEQFNCSQCHYKTILETEMKRHTYKMYHKDNLEELGKIEQLKLVDSAESTKVQPSKKRKLEENQIGCIDKAEGQGAGLVDVPRPSSKVEGQTEGHLGSPKAPAQEKQKVVSFQLEGQRAELLGLTEVPVQVESQAAAAGPTEASTKECQVVPAQVEFQAAALLGSSEVPAPAPVQATVLAPVQAPDQVEGQAPGPLGLNGASVKADDVLLNIKPANQGQDEFRSECLICTFGNSSEEKYDDHMEKEHNVPRPLPRALHPDGMQCQDCVTKETVVNQHTQKLKGWSFK